MNFSKKLATVGLGVSIILAFLMIFNAIAGGGLSLISYGFLALAGFIVVTALSFLFLIAIIALPIVLIWQLIDDTKDIAAKKKDIEAMEAELKAFKELEKEDSATPIVSEPATTAVPIVNTSVVEPDEHASRVS